MAIVEMKRLTLLALLEDRTPILRTMQQMQCVEITELPSEFEPYKVPQQADETQGNLTRLQWALTRLSRYDTQPKPAFSQYPAVSAEEAAQVIARKDEVLLNITRLEATEKQAGDLRAREARLKAACEQYTPWTCFPSTAQALSRSRSIVQKVGLVLTRNLSALEEAFVPLAAHVQVLGQWRENSYIYCLYHQKAGEEATAALSASGFTAESFAAFPEQTPKDYVDGLTHELAALADERAALDSETRALASALPDLKILHDALTLEIRQHEAAAKTAHTSRTFLLSGWVPSKKSEQLRKRINKISPSASLTLEDPKDDEEPTILLENGPFATAFEPVIEGFAWPAYRGIDPSAVMAPFYVCLFGMMLSDAGYGLLIAVALLLFVKIKKIPLRNARMLYLLIFGGVSTIIWGLVYNTVFGLNPIPVLSDWFPLDPVNKPMPVIGVCLGIGAIHLFSGLGVAAYMNIRKKDYVSAVSDQLSWFLLLLGLAFLLVPSLAKAGQVMALCGVVIILLMKGRDKKNPIKRLMSGLGALYGITSWVSDLLSYMRLFGMGLATGVIGMVFNILIGMLWNAGFIAKILAIVLFILCHLFNLGINALGAYVHACRLQYIEFFGKFFEDGGKPFRPLHSKTRYVSIQAASADSNAGI